MTDVVRSALWLVFFGVIFLAWWMLFVMAGEMGLDLLGRPDSIAQTMAEMDPRGPMNLPMARLGPLFAMWAVMMAAMMLPTMLPTLMTYERLMVSADGTRSGWCGVLLGFFVIWVGFAGLIAAVQLLLLHAGLTNMLGAGVRWFAVGLLGLVGLYQFTGIKAACHGVCHAPLGYFLGHWQAGFRGGLRMGMGLGVYCVGCCWGYMVLGFVGGVMSLAWMGLVTFLMILEKLPQIGHHVIKPIGALMIWAAAVWAII